MCFNEVNELSPSGNRALRALTDPPVPDGPRMALRWSPMVHPTPSKYSMLPKPKKLPGSGVAKIPIATDRMVTTVTRNP
jgi:hypothetical protein